MQIRRLIEGIKMRDSTGRRQQRNNSSHGHQQEDQDSLSLILDENLQKVKNIFDESSDLVIREFRIGAHTSLNAFIILLNGLVDEKAVNADLINPLMFLSHDIERDNLLAEIRESALSAARVKEVKSLDEIVDAILSGDTVLFIDQSNIALIVSMRGGNVRNVEEPSTEAVVRGPREGFVEGIGTNIALLRRKMKNPALKFFPLKIGRQTRTDVCVAYLKGIANDKIVQEVKTRLTKIHTDSILESGYIESFIEDAPLSPFPTVGAYEKPDIICAKLLEGRVAILVDGTPFVLTVPYLFIEAFQSSEDYYIRPFFATFLRWLRWLSFFFATTLPGLYVAITTFHQEFLPPALLVSIAAAHEGTPFPSVVEALLLNIIYEILREAGLRLPRPIGQAVSIVGALVIGEAAVSAGLVGAPMVVVVALTAISAFVVPTLIDISTLIRFALIILAGFSGLYGIMLGFIFFVTHQISLRSFGAPYMSPFAPSTFSDLKDVIIRAPLWAMRTRPRVLGEKDSNRLEPNAMPTPPKDQKGEN